MGGGFSGGMGGMGGMGAMMGGGKMPFNMNPAMSMGGLANGMQ